MNNRILVLFILFVSISSFTCSGSNANIYIDKNLKSKECLSNLPSTPESFQLFSHGRAGELLIDGEWLTAPQIATWLKKSKLLKGITHINIYACEFGKGVKGQNAVAYLEKLLNITLAASDDITGANGDWNLEVGTRKDVLEFPNYPYSLQNEFITTWEVSAGDLEISIPVCGWGFTYNYVVDWGDGMPNSTNQTGDAKHTYAKTGVYTVKISGTFPAIYFNDRGDKDKIKTIEQWGDLIWESMNYSFSGCSNLTIRDGIEPPNLSLVKDMSWMFRDATRLDADVNEWDVSSVTNMSYMFVGATSFTGKGIDKWDVGNVNKMYEMFGSAKKFDADLSGWNPISVTDMGYMFFFAESFQGVGLNNWNVSTVSNMKYMFSAANSFIGDISNWNVSNVTQMDNMFQFVTLSPTIYTSLLNSWAKLLVKNNVRFSGGNSKYCDDSGKNILVSKGWIIKDGGKIASVTVDLGTDQINCKGNTIILDAGNPGATYLWNTGETSQTISVNTMETFNVEVSFSNGCSASDTIKFISDIKIDLGADRNICEGGTPADLTITPEAGWGPNLYYEWSTSVTNVIIPVPAYGQTILTTDKTGDYTLTVTDQNECKSTDEIHLEVYPKPIVDINISDKSSPMCLGTTFELDAGNSRAAYVWGGKATGKTSQKITHILKDPAGANFDVEVTNEFGCIASDNIHVIAKVDHIVPTITFPALSDDKITAYTDPGRNVSSTVSWGTLDVTDNCHIKSITNNAPVTMEFPVGETKVLWQAEDFSGNIEDHTITVIVVDIESPVAPVSADLTGECSITAVSPTTMDNCSGTITGTTTDPLSYTMQGTYVIQWIFDDGNGNSITVPQNVIVDDVTAPVIPNLPDLTEECSITVVSPTTTDNCSGKITGTTTDPLSYTTQGIHVINWTFDDGNGNSITVPQNVIVDDVIAPVIPNLPDLTEECSITAVSPTTIDNCSGTITGTTTDPLSYTTQGIHVINWTFDDGNGNSITVPQNVILDDVTVPIAPVLDDVSGMCTISLIEPMASDNCAGEIQGTTLDPLTYNTEGSYVINWTFDDGNGNISNTAQNVDVFTIVEEVELNSSATELTCDVKNIDLTARAKVQGEAHYKWFKDNDLILGETASVLEIENGEEGEYSVEVSDKNLQCNVLSDPVLITEDVVVPMVSLSPLSGSLSSAESIIIRATVLTKGEAAYVWSTGEITSSIEVKYPGEYSVEVTDNANGCSVNSADIGQEAIIMNYWEENLLRAFTPNADGYNDSWRIERVELVQKLKIAIYNRWGKAIYKFSGSGNEYKGTPWKGTDGNGNLPIGSYYYVIKIDDEKPMKGTVTILR
ncbi:BspA family leucine-rich repeat surface protein [Labilibaculum antarcticum]|uniref:PKD domain-containing protein n=1 Tax=Labilibaculum antarcticum TaxID=1717717 RepID=A0A1Y1CJA7_9BACT|nr:BspA family leucine-rich repeat surface protein [Labilibaculum antarcticum]BAX79361.1 hypothetical protein ALGA_0974 [Labilibaculum antarcticum]